MFYTIELSQFLQTHHFTFGTGFYLVRYDGVQNSQDEIVFYNRKTSVWSYISTVYDAPTKLIELFEKEEAPEPEIAPTGTISMSEDFLLKLVAVSKVNPRTVKLSDILKTQ